MSFKYIAVAATLAFAPAAFAQDAGKAEPQIKPTQAAPGAPETSDRSPDKAAKTPQNQQDTVDGKTSDRSPNKNVTVDHQPGAAGTAGNASSTGDSSGEMGSESAGSQTTTPSATPPPRCVSTSASRTDASCHDPSARVGHQGSATEIKT